MKPLNKILTRLILVIFLAPGYNCFSQTAQKGSLSIALNYFTSNNQVPSLLVKVKTKVDGRFQNVGGVTMKLFLDKDSAGNFIGKVTTNDDGEASTYIPSSL